MDRNFAGANSHNNGASGPQPVEVRNDYVPKRLRCISRSAEDATGISDLRFQNVTYWIPSGWLAADLSSPFEIS